MLDQSFSTDNFLKTLEIENRKGRNLEKEFFPEVFEISKSIGEINKEINNLIRYRNRDEAKLIELNLRKAELKEYKKTVLNHQISEVYNNLMDEQFRVSIRKIETDNKPVYTLEGNPENYFAMKQLQYNLRKSFNVKQASRFSIINQVKCVLTDNFPKIVLRTDIKSFYESIPHNRLLAKINENSILSFLSKKLISGILKEYLKLSGSDEKTGIPRGIGISAYLAELYMREVDREITSLENVTYYARYVDDIIVIFTPFTNTKVTEYKEKIKAIIENSAGLKMNEEDKKTIEIELIKSNRKNELNFLGYMFQFENLLFQQIKLTEKKVNKYKERIKISLEQYKKNVGIDSKNARRLLVHRLNFLTSNTRLENNKDNVLVGIYYSNSLLTEKLEDLILLDAYLYAQIDTFILDEKLKNRLKLFSFKTGFENRRYSNFNSKIKRISLKKILEKW